MISHPLQPGRARNLILHGPSGTGKTRATLDEALRIVDPLFLEQHHGQRSMLKERFDALVDAGRIRRVTFHPGLDYADFVERRRSDAGTGERVEAGLFLQFCQDAASDAGRRHAHVLVIDDIHRGEVARIFGELLTLIEPARRLGEPEALQVMLPGSGRRFGVPANLHLIGTVNTSDCPLAELDRALSRRFVFREMPPQPDLLDGIAVEDVDLGALLRVMNERIEVLLGRDHRIGHGVLMPLAEPGAATLAALGRVFRERVVPLLLQHFAGDWKRIGWVLGDPSKILREHRFVQPGGPRTPEDLFGRAVAEQIGDRRWHLVDAAFDRIGSYRGILG